MSIPVPPAKPKHASIDLNLIDESRLEKVIRKNGKEGRFLNIVIFETPTSEYGTHLIKQEQSITEAEQNIFMPIIGNVRRPKQKVLKPNSTDSNQNLNVT